MSAPLDHIPVYPDPDDEHDPLLFAVMLVAAVVAGLLWWGW